MATALQLVNKVLRRLREDEAVTFTESYPNLILDFINESKHEVEDAWNWTSLRTTKTITTVAGTRQYAITGAGSRFRVYDMYNSTKHSWIPLAHNSYFNMELEDGDETQGSPSYYRVWGQDSNGDPYVEFSPVPDGVYTVKMYCHVPQADLVNTTDTLAVAEMPVVLGAWAKAISERGEDGGQNTIEQQLMYKSALSDAIAIDEAKTYGETTWQSI